MATIDLRPGPGLRQADLFVRVSPHWQRYKTGFGLFALNNGEYEIEGRKLWISLQLLARPNSLSHLVREFPEELESGAISENLKIGIIKGNIVADVNLSFIHEHLPEDQKIQMAWDLYPVAHWSRVSFAFKMIVILKTRISAPVGRTIEWDTQFCQGGLPGLGRGQ